MYRTLRLLRPLSQPTFRSLPPRSPTAPLARNLIWRRLATSQPPTPNKGGSPGDGAKDPQNPDAEYREHHSTARSEVTFSPLSRLTRNVAN